MSESTTDNFAVSPAAEARKLRLWPGITAVVIAWLISLVPRWLDLNGFIRFMGMFFGPMIGLVLFLIWWLFFSRVAKRDRWFGLLAIAVAFGVSYFVYHPSLIPQGLIMYGLPFGLTAWVGWLLVTQSMDWPARRVGLPIALMLGFGYCAALRFDGVDGDFNAALSYRWQTTAEQKFLAELANMKSKTPVAVDKPVILDAADWPGFRGIERDGRRPGVKLATDWKKDPPKLLWKHRVGPGWSSFAVVGNRIYTQEQRDKAEVVVCYDADYGTEVWTHKDETRFEEAVAGPGPRATPTFHEGRIYSLGANGKLNCLDAANGTVKWSKDAAADSKAKTPQWGFSASPCVSQGLVSVFMGGPDNKGVLAYKLENGDLTWAAGEPGHSYCSTQSMKLGGVEQLVVSTNMGLTSFEPATGKILWKYDWKLESMARITQPTKVDDADVLIGTGFGEGTHNVHVEKAADGKSWTSKMVWETKSIKPYYNDLVEHKGNLYGFDGSFFVCVNLKDQKGKWRARGYGSGQVLLLPDQDLLVILSEAGKVALVEAKPDGHKEIASIQAIEGKTWNHPVIARDKLFVRNGEEAACFQLAEAK